MCGSLFCCQIKEKEKLLLVIVPREMALSNVNNQKLFSCIGSMSYVALRISEFVIIKQKCQEYF